MDLSFTIAKRLGLPHLGVKQTLDLLAEGATIPFIARYRKEKTGSLDEVALLAIRDLENEIIALEKRRENIISSLQERNLLTPELQNKLQNSPTLTELEDHYAPFKEKRKTRAGKAREKGLEPLAKAIFQQQPGQNLKELFQKFPPSDKELSYENSLEGASDIIAEWLSEDLPLKTYLRKLYAQEGTADSRVKKGKKEEGQKFQDFFESSDKISTLKGHRIHALLRGEKEGFLNLHLGPPLEKVETVIFEHARKKGGGFQEFIKEVASDCAKRLLHPSLENEIRSILQEKADKEAIEVFCKNLQALLMSPALGRKKILAVDPGFRTGCKIACLSETGDLILHSTLYLHDRGEKWLQTQKELLNLYQKEKFEMIAIGNGTASRESEKFFAECEGLKNIPRVIVDEAGASIYSASEVAREEFPDLDLTVRGTVSIGRRLQDPMAELIKIDPKSIGVGQYQHDVDQPKLKRALDDTLMSCVNQVGVELNSASSKLLSYISGIGPVLAGKIIEHRREKGPFKNRKELLKVPRLGQKVFEQAAGFLRIREGNHPLDNTGIHPENYPLVSRMADEMKITLSELPGNTKIIDQIPWKNYLTDEVGEPTLKDILLELKKPGRDPRKQFERVQFDEKVQELKDLQPGMVLEGVIKNITHFGAFVDIGIKENGLLHISQVSDRFISNPLEVLSVQQRVKVKVLEIDSERKRISLTRKGVTQP